MAVAFQLVSMCRSQGEPQVPSECPGLTVVSNDRLYGSQVVVNDAFVTNVNHIVECAKPDNLRLLVVSASRCNQPRGQQVVKGHTSDHLIGMAIDIQPHLPHKKKAVSKDDMAAAWCAFNMDKEPCKTKYSTDIPQQALNYCDTNKDKLPCKDYTGFPLQTELTLST